MDLGIGGVSDAVELRAANGIESYKAQHERLRRPVVVKLLPPEVGSLLADEMRTLATVSQGPGIVRVHESGTTDAGRPYLISDYYDESLLDRLTERGPMGPFRACAVLAEVADALFYAHERGVVHGNIRPSNIMNDDGQFLLTDFGSAGAVAFDGDIPMPSLSYVGPEDVDGQNEPGPKSDVYALGSTLFHLVTGRPPFANQPATAVSRQLPDLRNSALPDEVCEVIESAMATKPNRRPSVGGLRQTLQRTARAGGQSVGVARPSGRPAMDQEPSSSIDDEFDEEFDEEIDDQSEPVVDDSPLGPNAVPMRGTAAQVRELRSSSQREEKSDNSWASSALALALFVGAIGILFFGLRAGTSGGDSASDQEETELSGDERSSDDGSAESNEVVDGDIAVPAVAGQRESEALATLRGLGIQVALDFEPSTEVAEGMVIRSVPEAGGKVPSGESASLVISTGPPVEGCANSVVPDIEGSAAAPARDAASAAGLEPSLVQQPSQTVVPGNVISTSLVAGDCVPAGTPINLVIACTSVVIPEIDQFSTAEMEAQGLNVVTRDVVTNSAEPGSLVGTTPPAGTPVCTRGTVAVNIAVAGECPQVPDVIGRSQSDAVASMDSFGYSVQIRNVPSDTVQVGLVVASNPPRGTPLCADGAVTIDVSGGSATPDSTGTTQNTGSTSAGSEVSVPYVYYLDAAEAERILVEAGLDPQVSEYQSIYSDHPFVGTVRSTNPGPQSLVAVGSRVDLIVWCAEPCE